MHLHNKMRSVVFFQLGPFLLFHIERRREEVKARRSPGDEVGVLNFPVKKKFTIKEKGAK